MSSSRSNVNSSQGRPIKPIVAPARNTASPLTPRLATNSTSATKKAPSPKRPFVRSAVGTRSPSPTKDTHTPIRSATADKSTPRSSVRVTAKGGSTVSTPTPGNHGTPGSIRAKSPLVAPHLAGRSTPNGRTAQPKSSATVPFVRKTVQDGMAQKSPPVLRTPANQTPAQPGIDAVILDNPNPLFFHASDAKAQEPPKRPPPPKKTPTFVYADGRQEELQGNGQAKGPSPPLSAVSGRRPSAPSVQIRGTFETTPSPLLISPPLSAVSSSRSPFFPSPSVASSALGVSFQTKDDTAFHNLGSLNVPKLRSQTVHQDRPASIAVTTEVVGLNTAREASLGSGSPRGHIKSASVSAGMPESPSAARKRSATWSKANEDLTLRDLNATFSRPQTLSPRMPQLDLGSLPSSPLIASEIVQSPTREKAAPDFAAEARRERKVLDLEISNSSLLAINRSLEREAKKQKAELKRYRRLSRAGQLSRPVERTPRRLDAVGEDENELPSIDGATTRPSSPFESEVSDLSDSEEDDDDASSTSPTSSSRTSYDAKTRAKDEERLRRDLRKHRDLILDTAQVNRSLQKCLTWTEDLIKDGKKALEHKVRREEIQLGGRILSDDDEDAGEGDGRDEDEDMSFEDGNVLGSGSGQDDEKQDGEDLDVMDMASPGQDETDFSTVEAFLGLGPWNNTGSGPDDLSLESPPRTDRDSGIEIQKGRPRKCSRSPAPRPDGGDGEVMSPRTIAQEKAAIRRSLGATFRVDSLD